MRSAFQVQAGQLVDIDFILLIGVAARDTVICDNDHGSTSKCY